MRKLINKKTVIAAVAIGSTILFGASDCDGTDAQPTGQQQENQSRQQNYNNLIQTQPAEHGEYSPTRATKNFWITTWMQQKGKVAYVYLRDANSNVFGYYVTDGLPVSYCTSLIPPYQFVRGDGGEYRQDFVVPGPSVDGTFSSASNCSEFYARDAVTGAYIEYSVGMGINQQISDQPLPQYGDAKPLGQGTIKQVQNK